jgi:hypothetical protein
MTKSSPSQAKAVWHTSFGTITPEVFYCDLMQDIKIRSQCIEEACCGGVDLPGEISKDLCYFQLRNICETIAIACLVIHQDESDIKKLSSIWSAPEIMAALEKMNPNYFPVAITLNRTNNNKI